MSRVSKFAIASLTALGLAVTPMNATAGPSQEDVAKTLAGLAILGIVGTAINNRNDRRDREREAAQTNRIGDLYGNIDEPRDRRIINGELRRRGDLGPKPDRGYRRHPLPDRCLRIVDTDRGERLVYGERCLNRHYKFARKLPENCARYVRTNRGLRSVFASRCLARDGWQVARR